MSGFIFEKHSNYCALRFTPEMESMAWPDVENATKLISDRVHDANVHAVLIDLSQLQKVPAGLLPSIVRIWKAMDSNKRRFVVYATAPTIRDELKQAGLDGLWTVANSTAESFKALKVSGDSDHEIDQPTLDTEADVAVSDYSGAPIRFQHQKKFDSVQFFPVAMTMSWMEVETATTEVIRQLNESENMSVMVDLGQMKMINSGLIASLVRIWKAMKERNGQFSIVSPNDQVTDVLKTAGLWKLWSVVEDREEAVYELGVSRAAIVEKRERRFLVFVAVPCSVIAVLALILMLLKRTDVMGVNAQLAALQFASAGIATGLISIVKDTGKQRIMSCFAVALGAIVLSSLFFRGNLISIYGTRENAPAPTELEKAVEATTNSPAESTAEAPGNEQTGNSSVIEDEK
jgi:anti-anti-sigma factor